MKRETLLLVATAMLTPLAYAQPAPPVPGCNPAAKACNVIVAVDDDCKPRPNPDPVRPGAISPAVINWRIDPGSARAGFAFVPGRGVVISVDPAQFSAVSEASPIHVHVTDRNTNQRTYKYAINVQKNGVACPTLDPTIVNGRN